MIPRFCGVSLGLSLYLIAIASLHATDYTLTVITNGSGAIAENPTNSIYSQNSTVTLTATPSAGWYFANWSGATNASVNPVNVTMYSDLVVTGSFLPYPIYTLTLMTNGLGTIGLNPPGGSYYSNLVVTATATPAVGWYSRDGRMPPIPRSIRWRWRWTRMFR